ncbi:hypothetical protein KCP76_08260 [Salmonella enterica subsp. enterica serovar Weltevreden]|nr:hypothetical protein KCP76_08260 [Salmonella enterica subsp. enterica serovar Weltevreden]
MRVSFTAGTLMMTTLLPLFPNLPTSFPSFDGERFIGVCSSSGLFFFISCRMSPAERTPDFVTRMVQTTGITAGRLWTK